MNIPGSAGESSCKRQENGDGSGTERPLKKARFAWQVKGKYHLKNEIAESASPAAVANEPDRPELSSENESESNDLVGNAEQNLEILGDYLLKQDFNSLDAVITSPEKSLLKPSTSISSDNLQYPRYVSSYDNSSSNSSRSRCNSNEHVLIPMSMVVTPAYCEDQCIARWQARQMAKGFVDNTINRVLDSWMVAPLPTEMENNRFLALDVAEFINNLPGDNSIENEGILMAISAHGLQNTSNSSSVNQNEPSSSFTRDDIFISQPNSPIVSDDVAQEQFTTDKPDDSSSELDMTWSYNEDDRRSDINSVSFSSELCSSSFFNVNETANIDYDRDDDRSPNEDDILNNHYDFLDAAVSFAIQNKGLTSFGTDYG